MTSQVVTSFSTAGADAYGRRCVARFTRSCAVPLVVYLDAPMDVPGAEARMTSDIPGWPETRAMLPNRRDGAARPEYYRWHARRFAVKPFVWCDAAERLGNGVLTWLDGDTSTHARIPETFFTELLDEADVAFLGRGPMHPETGYVGFRVPQALALLRWCRDAYQSGDVLTWEDGWTDCHALRAGLRAVPTSARDLTSHRYDGKAHIWPVSPLAPYIQHFKGGKKPAVQAC